MKRNFFNIAANVGFLKHTTSQKRHFMLIENVGRLAKLIRLMIVFFNGIHLITFLTE